MKVYVSMRQTVSKNNFANFLLVKYLFVAELSVLQSAPTKDASVCSLRAEGIFFQTFIYETHCNRL